MIFAPFAFKNQIITGITPITSGYSLYVEANNSTSYPGTGTTWFDLSANATNGTLTNGPTFTSSTPSYFTFNGTTQYVSFPFSTYGADSGSYSFGGWFNTTTLANAYKMIFSRGQDGAGNGWSLQIRLNNLNRIEACVVARTGTGSYTEYDATAPSASSANTWYNVYGVWESATSIKLYINGSLITTVTAATKNNLRSSSVAWSVSWNLSPYQYGGRVSNFLIYNSVLSATDILNNYNAQKATYGL
jgi:hypothetical protein